MCGDPNKEKILPQLQGMQQHGVSKTMIGKMAEQGVTTQELNEEYRKYGRKGLEVCLAVNVCGKPRVTKSKKILDKIEAYLKSRITPPVQ